MNPRLEIASRLLAARLTGCNTGTVRESHIREVASLADALIKECGDQPSLCEVSVIETNAALVEKINRDEVMSHFPKCETRDLRERAEYYRTGWNSETAKREKDQQLIRQLQDDLVNLRRQCQKLVEEWRMYNSGLSRASDQLESALAAMIADRDKLREELAKSKSETEHSRQWYAVRFERMRDWVNKWLADPAKNEFFAIMANGTGSWTEQPTYSSMIQSLKFEVERLQNNLSTCTSTCEEQTLTIRRLEKELSALRQPPKCPKCGSSEVAVCRTDEYGWLVECLNCDENITQNDSIDAALNAWRKV